MNSLDSHAPDSLQQFDSPLNNNLAPPNINLVSRFKNSNGGGGNSEDESPQAAGTSGAKVAETIWEEVGFEYCELAADEKEKFFFLRVI